MKVSAEAFTGWSLVILELSESSTEVGLSEDEALELAASLLTAVNDIRREDREEV